MKKTLLIVMVMLVAALVSVPAADRDSPLFQPFTPEVLAQGNSFTAVAHGYNALFTNPAGFAREGGSFTLLSATATPYFVPTDEDIEGLQTLGDKPEDAVELLSGIVTTNGIGAGVSIGGLGIVGRNLGLGLVGNFDFYGRANRYALSTKIDVAHTVSAIAGYAFPFRFSFATINVGADLRFMQRAEIRDIYLTDFLAAAGGSDGEDEDIAFDVLYGNGLAIDFGVIAERGPFTVGLSFRDLGGTKLNYSLAEDVSGDDIGSVLAFDGGTLGGEEAPDEYRIPMTFSYGASYHPNLGLLKWLIDPTIHFEVANTLYQERDPSFWTRVHAGAEVRVLRFIKARAGINQGYATAGLGVKLLFLDVNVAYFTRELSDYAGARPNEGFSVEAALRF
jgi:opacity protein-like surface antigen